MSTDEQIADDLRRYVPPPGFDASAALAAGRRSVRRRRLATGATAVTAVVAVLGVAVAAGSSDAPSPDVRPAESSPRPSLSIAAAPSAVPARALSSAGDLSCVATPLEKPADGGRAMITAVSPDGRIALGTVQSYTGFRSVVWQDGRIRSDGPGPTWIVANRAGVLAGYEMDTADVHRARPFVRRGDVIRELPTPAGYRAAIPMAVTEAGDVFGTLRRGEMVMGDGPFQGGYNFHNGRGVVRDLDVVVWPAATPDAPRVLSDPGEATVVGVAGTDRMIGVVQVGAGERRPHSWSVTGAGGPLALPAGWTNLDPGVVDGAYLYGSQNETTVVRWNLATGRAEPFTGAGGVRAGNEAGWFAASVDRGDATLLVAPDGTARKFPGNPLWISNDGTTAVGATNRQEPMSWAC